jgi:type II secretory ATPase GspE/PulE/Tfp pilus assembly ATPase PilB-like protein
MHCCGSPPYTHMRIENINDDTLREILLQGNYITAAELKRTERAVQSGLSLNDALLAENIVSKDLIGQAVAEALNVPYADLNSLQPTREQVLKLPEEIARQYHLVLFTESEDGLIFATDNPQQEEIIAALTPLFPSQKITLGYALPEDIEESFIHYRKPLDTRFGKIITHGGRIAPELLEEIFEDAVLYRASDIHFEPRGPEIVIRFRIDGVLHEAGRVPREFYENILNRIKVRSLLRIDEHFRAQDGSMSWTREGGGQSLDIRTSIVPTVEGEKIVLRVLASYVAGLTLADIGLLPRDEEIVEETARAPFGMILVTGPTGAGKTTTLYSVLKLLNRPEVNITTIEDPVEYKIVGVNQIQVNTQTNLLFASGLRSIVRQNPDIILVGEIRDNETAEIAVNAALTGHLLLSSFHANDAPTAIPRLIDMGIEPFLLASTLKLIMAQRLVRKICESCRQSSSMTPKELAKTYPTAAAFLPQGKTITLYHGSGCENCGGTGYRGRTAVFELIRITPALEACILGRPSTPVIRDLARKEGTRPMFLDGIEKVMTGVTTFEELLRVAEPPRD